MAECRQNDAHFRRSEAAGSLCAVRHVKHCFGIEDDVGLQWLSDHLARVEASAAWQRIHQASPDAVGRFTEKTETHDCFGIELGKAVADRLHPHMQLCRISGLHCEVAEKQTDLASAFQACGNRACLIRPAPSSFKGRDYPVKHCEHPRRRDDHLVGQCDQVLVVSRIDQVDLGALLDDLAQALRQQRMILAQK